MKAEKLIIGNFITIDDNIPFAKAVTLIDGKIQYVGSIETAKSLCDENTIVLDYGNNYIYPGFMDGHTHGMFAGYRSLGQANLIKCMPPSLDGYRQIIKKFIDDNPNKELYLCAGWVEDGITVFTSEFLDELCKDKPLIMNTVGGHSILLNRKAMEIFNINKEFVEKYGPELVRVDENGNPTGYICEIPAVNILQSLKISVEEAKNYILDWQRFAFSKGFVGAIDAGIELMSPNALDAYISLNEENELNLYTYGYILCEDNLNDPKQKAKEIAELSNKYNTSHFKVVGAKVFLDGVVEAHTAWLINDYNDKNGYHGNERFNDIKKLSELIIEADKYGLNVHSHSDGDGATKFFLDAVELAQKTTGNLDQRNAAAHLQIVSKEDIQRMADTNTIAVVAPLWVPKLAGTYEVECNYLGKQRNDSVYPIKSFIDSGAVTVFHTDYPISPSFDVPMSIYLAVTRCLPAGYIDGVYEENSLRGEEERINRIQALKSMTINVAYQLHEENNIGSITNGKIANFSILDKDLLNDDLNDILKTKIVATIVDGKEVYHCE